MCRFRDICAPVESDSIGRKSRLRGRNPGDDDILAFDRYGFVVREPNSVEIRLSVLEILSYIRIHTLTDISSLYMEVVASC